MRILLKIKCLGDFSYDDKYFTKVQGLIYDSIKSIYPELHDHPSYKFFCFSNIFPLNIENGHLGHFKEGEIKNLIISSPDHVFIKALNAGLPKTIHVGEYCFEIVDIRILNPKIKRGDVIRAATPIVIRIPKYNYERYGISSNKDYVFWRANEHPIQVFVKQLEENLIKKYKQYRHEETEEIPIFDEYKYIKSTCNHIITNGMESQIIGSIWEFRLGPMRREQKELLQFGFDAGFGEKNPMGFGFVNRIEKNVG